MKKEHNKRVLNEHQKANAAAWRRPRTVTFEMSCEQFKALKWFMGQTSWLWERSPSEAAKEFLLHMLDTQTVKPDPKVSTDMGGAIVQAHERYEALDNGGFASLSSYVDAKLRKNFVLWRIENEKIGHSTFGFGEKESEG